MKSLSFVLFSVLLITTHCDHKCCEKDTLSVEGAGAIRVDPDIATFSITANGKGKTSLEALQEVNTLIAKADRVLKYYGLPAENRTTSRISIRPQYDFSNGTSTLIGQQASISLDVTLGNLETFETLLGRIIRSLSAIDGLQISGFSFKNSNTRSAFAEARRAAVRDARSKAEQYATLSGKRLKSVRRIVDQGRERYIPFALDSSVLTLQSKWLGAPSGKVQVNANVLIDWNL